MMNNTLTALVESTKKPFIVREVRADMLRPHPRLSKGAQHLWVRMLGMANAKTGELRHRDHWYDGADIQKRAQICDRLRKKYIQELVAAGFVRFTRDRVIRVIKGRKRAVLGETRYWIFKSPHWDLASSTVTFGNRSRKSPTILSETHQGGGASLVGRYAVAGSLPPATARTGTKKHHHHPDDLLARARKILLEKYPGKELWGSKGDPSGSPAAPDTLFLGEEKRERNTFHTPLEINCALEVIEHRVHDCGITPRSPQYYVQAFENLSEHDWQIVDWYVREGPDSGDRRKRVNALILFAEQEAKRLGRDFLEVFHELRQDPRCYEPGFVEPESIVPNTREVRNIQYSPEETQ